MTIAPDAQPKQGAPRTAAGGRRRRAAAALMLFSLLLAASAKGEADALSQARRFIAEENYTAASELMRKAVRQDDAPLDAWMMLGAAYEGQGLTRRAIAAYEEVMRRDRHHLEGGLGLGRNLVQDRRERPRAVSLYKSLLEVYPGEPRLQFALGMAYNEMAEISYAFDQYKLLKQTAPGLAQQLYDAIFMK